MVYTKSMAYYETPSVTLFRNRKRFHESAKSTNESISDWFKRLQTFAKKCGYKHSSEYMLIDKFVSGLSEIDFEKISKVPIWTVEELVLVVIGNAHVFKCKESKNSQEPKANVLLQKGAVTDTLDKTHRQSSASEIQHFKVEEDAEEIDDALAQCSLNGTFDDGLHERSTTQPAEIKTDECNTDSKVAFLSKLPASEPEKVGTTKMGIGHRSVGAPLTASERKKNFIERLKLKGTFEAYQRANAEKAKESRINAKHNEQYLPSELHVHIINERRRIKREKVRQFREKKKQEMAVGLPQHLIEPNIVLVEPKSESDAVLGPELNPLNEAEHNMQPKETKKTRASKRTGSKKPYARKKSFECYLCSLECSNMYELRTHLNIFHRLEKLFELKCSFCSMTTRSREVLSRHLRKVHGEYPVHKCPCCDEDFKQRSDLNKHVQKVHPDHRPFVCEICGKSYKTSSDLNYHTNGHTSQEVFKCEICDHTFASLKTYKMHMAIHTDIRRFSCNICGKAFRSRAVLNTHLICVHKQGQKPFQCEICAKRFMIKHHLKLHHNSHTGKRPFQCETCESAFTQPSSLKLHIRKVHEKNAKT